MTFLKNTYIKITLLAIGSALLAQPTYTQYIASASRDGTIIVRDLHQEFRTILKVNIEGDAITSVAFHPTNKYILISASQGGKIRMWHISEKPECIGVLAKHECEIWTVAFCQTDGDTIAYGTDDKMVIVCDLSKKPNEQGYRRTLEKHKSPLTSVVFHPTEKNILASVAEDPYFIIWDISEQPACFRILRGHEDNVNSIAFHPTRGGIVFSASADGTVRMWNISKQPTECLRILGRHENILLCVAPHPTENLVAYGSEEGALRIWHKSEDNYLEWMVGESDINAVAFHPTKKNLIAFASDSGAVIILNTSKKSYKILREHSAPVSSIAFSPTEQESTFDIENRNLREETVISEKNETPTKNTAIIVDGDIAPLKTYRSLLLSL